MGLMDNPRGSWAVPLNITDNTKTPLKFDIPVEIQKLQVEDRFSRLIYPKELSKKIMEHRHRSLVGKFVGIRPNIESLKEWKKNKWIIKGRVDLIPLACDHILFNFVQMEDLQWVLQNGPWWFGKSGLILKSSARVSNWKEKISM